LNWKSTMVIAAALMAPINATMVRCLLERNDSPGPGEHPRLANRPRAKQQRRRRCEPRPGLGQRRARRQLGHHQQEEVLRA